MSVFHSQVTTSVFCCHVTHFSQTLTLTWLVYAFPHFYLDYIPFRVVVCDRCNLGTPLNVCWYEICIAYPFLSTRPVIHLRSSQKVGYIYKFVARVQPTANSGNTTNPVKPCLSTGNILRTPSTPER